MDVGELLKQLEEELPLKRLEEELPDRVFELLKIARQEMSSGEILLARKVLGEPHYPEAILVYRLTPEGVVTEIMRFVKSDKELEYGHALLDYQRVGEFDFNNDVKNHFEIAVATYKNLTDYLRGRNVVLKSSVRVKDGIVVNTWEKETG